MVKHEPPRGVQDCNAIGQRVDDREEQMDRFPRPKAPQARR